MSKQTITELIDDIDGDEAAETVRFSLDGTAYEIDLSAVNAEQLRAVVEPYRVAGRRVSGSRPSLPRAAATTNKEHNQAVRDWARRNGRNVSDRGRIEQSVVDAFNAVHR